MTAADKQQHPSPSPGPPGQPRQDPKQQQGGAAPADPNVLPIRMKPRPKLVAVMGVVVALWLVALLVMYFKWVRPIDPHRESVEPKTSSE